MGRTMMAERSELKIEAEGQNIVAPCPVLPFRRPMSNRQV